MLHFGNILKGNSALVVVVISDFKTEFADTFF